MRFKNAASAHDVSGGTEPTPQDLSKKIDNRRSHELVGGTSTFKNICARFMSLKQVVCYVMFVVLKRSIYDSM
jgi:hypothetical protein